MAEAPVPVKLGDVTPEPPDDCLSCKRLHHQPGRIQSWWCVENDITMRRIHQGERAPGRIEPGRLCVLRKCRGA